jgi:hypothetical protein
VIVARGVAIMTLISYILAMEEDNRRPNT